MEPLYVASNDWHIKKTNRDQILDLVEQKCELALELDIDDLFVLGDIFDSRVSQTLEVLNTFDRCLELIDSYGLVLHGFPGNHDKTNYSKSESFLTQFRHHPAFNLIEEYTHIDRGDLRIHVMPFFSEEKWLELYKPVIREGKTNILLSHIAVEGSVNNDGTRVSTPIKTSMFINMDAVYLGHYHNEHKVGSNIFHLPCIQQNDFGEDNRKGFSIIYEDGSRTFQKSIFKEFVKVTIDVDTMDDKEIAKIKKRLVAGDIHPRIEFVGAENKVKAINKSKFTELGIDVKTKIKEIEVNTNQVVHDFKKFKKEDIVKHFEEFCTENQYSYEEGIELLQQTLN